MNYTKHKRIKKEITPNTHHHHQSSNSTRLKCSRPLYSSHTTPHTTINTSTKKHQHHNHASNTRTIMPQTPNNAPTHPTHAPTPHKARTRTHNPVFLNPQTLDNQATMKCHHPHPNGMSTNTRYVSTRLKNKQQQHKRSLNHPTPNANLHGKIKTP